LISVKYNLEAFGFPKAFLIIDFLGCYKQPSYLVIFENTLITPNIDCHA